MSLVTASERDTAQTEALRGHVVYGLATNTGSAARSLLERSVRQGESPVVWSSTAGASPGVAGVGNPS